MFTVRRNTGLYGYWDYAIVDAAGHVVKSGVYDPQRPDSPYAAERVARAMCAKMNAGR